MAYYLVKAKLKDGLSNELRNKINNYEFENLQPFGKALTYSLKNSKIHNEFILWEEEDYCTPPLAQEREAVLDKYFDIISVTRVNKDTGWAQIKNYPDYL